MNNPIKISHKLGILATLFLGILFITGLANRQLNLIVQKTPNLIENQRAVAGDVSNGLVAHWKFDGNLNDYAGSNNGTVLGNPEYVSGKIKQGINFDKGTVATLISSNSQNDIAKFGTNNFSLCFWAKSDTNASLTSYIINKHSGGASGAYVGFAIQHWSNSNIRLSLGSKYIYAPIAMSDGNFHFICAVRNNTTISLWHDGSETAGLDSPITDVSTALPLKAGSVDWKGIVDDIRIYNRALSADEVQNLYSSIVNDNNPDDILPDTPPVIITPPVIVEEQFPDEGKCSPNTYYIDYSSGNDSNSGICTGNPWKHAPGDPNAIGRVSTTVLKPGDTVLFKGGVVYYGGIEVAQSGSSGSVITYKTASDWGSGKAVLDGSQTPAIGLGFSIKKRSYILINGFEIRNFKTSSGSGGGIGIGGGNYVEVADNYIHDMGDWSTNLSNPNGGGIGATVGAFPYAPISNISIHGNDITRVGHAGISIEGGAHINVYENNIHNWIVWGIDVHPGHGYLLSDVQIYKNEIHDIYEYGLYGPHLDYIFVRDDWYSTNPNPLPATDVHIVGNSFYNTNPTDGVNSRGSTAFLYMSGNIQNVEVLNNTFVRGYNTAISIGDVKTPYPNNISIIGNSIVGNVSFKANNVTFKNNIVRSVNINQASDFSTLKMNNNLFVNGELAGHYVVRFLNSQNSESGAYTMSQWQAYKDKSFDQNSLYTADALFVSATDTHLQPLSSAMRAGENLYSLFSIDKDGNPRPATGPWTIGAYEYPNSNSLTCTSFTYTTWSSCINGIQNRAVLTYIPSNCSGGSPILTQNCNISPIQGDFDNNGSINSLDISILFSNWNTQSTTCDLNKDGIVNSLDYVIVVKNWTV